MAEQKVILEAHDIQSWEHVPKRGNYPEPIVGAFIKNKKGELLFVTSFKWKGVWSIPGGHVELGENLTDALRREVMEEVGLNVRVKRLISIEQAIFPKSFIKKKHFIFFDFLCESSSDKVKIDKGEVQGYKWIRPKDALKLKHNQYTRHALEIYLKGLQTSVPTELEKRLLD